MYTDSRTRVSDLKMKIYIGVGELWHRVWEKWRHSLRAWLNSLLVYGTISCGCSSGSWGRVMMEGEWFSKCTHGTELWVKWMCAVGCVELRRSLLGQIGLCNATNNHPPQNWQLLRDSPQTKKDSSWMSHLFCSHLSSQTFSLCWESYLIKLLSLSKLPSFYNLKMFYDNCSHTL